MAFPLTRTLSWSPGTDPNAGPVDHYEVSINNGQRLSTTAISVSVSIPGPGVYTAQVWAVNSIGESVPGSAVAVFAVPAAPVNVHFETP